MDVIEKATKVAKDVGNTIYTSTREQSELASLNVQKSIVEKKLNAFYQEIGKRYVEYIEKCETGEVFLVEDVLEEMQPEVDKLASIKEQIADKEAAIRQHGKDRQQKKAQEEFDYEKRKLDKALELEIITEDEYNVKLAFAQKKFDHYDALRKLEMQLDMDIITKEEYEEKKRKILA